MRRLTLPLGALLLVAPLLLPVQGLADEFVWAFHDYSPDLDPVRLDATTEIGVTTWSQRLRWRQIEPDLPEAGPSTVAEVTDAAVEAYASDESLDWAPYDTKLTALVGAGYDLVLEVGLGGYSCSPTWLGETATPDEDSLGRERYLARLDLHVRGTLRRWRRAQPSCQTWRQRSG